MKVTSYRELMADQANAAVRISGAHHSSWNQRLGQLDPAGKTGGVAGWDHTIKYNPRTVDEPLQEMFQNARVHNQDPADLKSYRSALKIVLHENVHMLAAEGRDHAQAQHAFSQQPGVRWLEESVTEIYSQQRLNDYIDDLGLDQVAPGIKDVQSKPVYQQYLPAAEAYAETIGQRSGLGSDEVIERLAIVSADQKFRTAAEIMYDNSDLPGLVPSDQRAAAVDRIAESMRPTFARIDQFAEDAPNRTRRQIGGQAARDGYSEMEALRKQWAQPAPQLLQDRSQHSERAQQNQQSAEGPAATNGQQAQEPQQMQGPEHLQGPQQVQGPGQVRQPVQVGAQAEGGGQQTAQSGELQQAMRVGLGGAAPMSSARQLGAGEQGARRGGEAAGQERQGPERGE